MFAAHSLHLITDMQTSLIDHALACQGPEEAGYFISQSFEGKGTCWTADCLDKWLQHAEWYKQANAENQANAEEWNAAFNQSVDQYSRCV